MLLPAQTTRLAPESCPLEHEQGVGIEVKCPYYKYKKKLEEK